LIFYTDSVVIGMFLNAAAITYYAIAGSLINYGRNIVSLTADTLYPAATRLDAKNDMAGLRDLQILGTRIALLVGLPLCIGFVFLGRQFMDLWMGKAYAASAVILIVLTIPQVTSMSQYISALILVGMAKHKILAYVALAEGVANLTLSIILVRKFGLMGVAWGTVIPHLVSTAVLIPLYTLRVLDMRWSTYLTRGFVRPLICAVPMAGICYAFSKLIENPSWLVFGAEVATAATVFAALSYFVCLSGTQQAYVAGKLRGLLGLTPIANQASAINR
jgi:O-antigen/teichoic acid export membrane protein